MSAWTRVAGGLGRAGRALASAPPVRSLAALGRHRASWLALAVMVGALLRYWGIFHGLREGYVYHPDALLATTDAWAHYLGDSWREGTFSPLYGALMALGMWLVETIGRYAATPPAWSFPLVAGASSVVTALLGTATIALTYLLGARAYGTAAGVLAAAFLSVCPLHSFQSHYPYRDVPMVFFLTLALWGCVALVTRPTVAVLALTAVAAAAATALKAAGLTVAAPLAVAVVVALVRFPRTRIVAGAAALLAGALGGVALLRGEGLGAFVAVAQELWAFARFYVTSYWRAVGPGSTQTAGLFVEWLGWPQAAALLVGVAVAAWRRRPADLVLLGFVVPAFAAVGMYPHLEERFLVFLLPAGAVLLGRAIAEGWTRAPRAARVGLAPVVALLLLAALLQSVWQGMLLTLPDTRALAGRWFAAHVPPETRIALEGYSPLGLERWPGASFFDPAAPLGGELAKADLLVTSSAQHDRYLDRPDRYPREARFFRALQRRREPIKVFRLAPLGFLHPTTAVYLARAHAPARGRPVLVPRPYDASWSDGVALLDGSPYDRDDRTVHLRGAGRYVATLVSPETPAEVAVFALAGRRSARLQVQVGWRTEVRDLRYGELAVLRFRPRWLLPRGPALTRVVLSVLPAGRDALFQIRAGPREIGRAHLGWGRASDAVPYLERAVAAAPDDVASALLLAQAYAQVDQPAAARRALERLGAEVPEVAEAYRRLADTGAPAEAWARDFAAVTGLDAGLLTFALGQTLEAEALTGPAGTRAWDPAASAEFAVEFEPARAASGVVLDGPGDLYLERGAYRARVALRADPGATGAGPVAILRVLAGESELASRAVGARDLGRTDRFVDVDLPFVHADQRARVTVRLEATGQARLAVDRIRLEPDLRATLRDQAALLLGAGRR